MYSMTLSIRKYLEFNMANVCEPAFGFVQKMRKEFETDADLIDYVSRTSGAIGYSCTQPDITMVKILSIK